MKIITKTVIDIVTGATLHEDSYEYDGPVAYCKGGENAFRQQSMQNVGGYYSNQSSYQDHIMGVFDQQFANQTGTLDFLKSSLKGPLGGGPGGYQYNPHDPFYRDQGPGGQGQDPSGGGGAGNGGGGGAAGGGGTDANGEGSGYISGFNPGDYNVRYPGGALGKMKRAMESDVRSDTGDAFQDASQAQGVRMQQLGMSGLPSGAKAAMLSKLESGRAATEAEGLRDVAIDIAGKRNENNRLYSQLLLQAGVAKGGARMQDAGQHNQYNAQQQAMRNAQAARAAAARQASANARMAKQMQTASMRQSAFEFGQRMQLAGAQLQSDNFFRSAGLLSGAADMYNPLGYGGLGGQFGGMAGQGALGALGQSRPYTSAWGSIGRGLAGLAGGALSAFTGGMGQSMFGGGSPSPQNYGGAYW